MATGEMESVVSRYNGTGEVAVELQQRQASHTAGSAASSHANLPPRPTRRTCFAI